MTITIGPMSLTFERVYGSHRAPAVPPNEILDGAENQIPNLHPERTHVLTTSNGRAYTRQPLSSYEGWIITYTPTAKEPTTP